MAIMSGLSGNEMYCLHLKGLTPGDLVLGNSVYSMGFMGGLGAGLRSIMGGEVTQITDVIHEGRLKAIERMEAEAEDNGGFGISGVTSELKMFRGNIEFISVGTCVRRAEGASKKLRFSTHGDGQELYCLLDAGFTPESFAFGNVAYSIGVGGGVMARFKSLKRGEIKEYSNVLNKTRRLALKRLQKEARQYKANAVIGVETSVMPFQGVHEMMMTGTAATHPALPEECFEHPVTSDLTCEEMWNLANMGFLPMKLLMGTAVYSLGLGGGLKSWFKSFSKGEIKDLTTLIYDAREHAIGLIRDEAEDIGADDVVGIKTHIHELGSLIEFMAIGTAVKKYDGVTTLSRSLPPQAIINDKNTWVSGDAGAFATLSKDGES
jgi:uncharacterized protein YbjQ (UPF0145 family)